MRRRRVDLSSRLATVQRPETNPRSTTAKFCVNVNQSGLTNWFHLGIFIFHTFDIALALTYSAPARSSSVGNRSATKLLSSEPVIAQGSSYITVKGSSVARGG